MTVFWLTCKLCGYRWRRGSAGELLLWHSDCPGKRQEETK